VIRVIIHDPSVRVARLVRCRRAPSPSNNRGWAESLVFEIPDSVTFDGKPGKNEETGNDHAKTDYEGGEGSWLSGTISGWVC
jgi:hypothetical protein